MSRHLKCFNVINGKGFSSHLPHSWAHITLIYWSAPPERGYDWSQHARQKYIYERGCAPFSEWNDTCERNNLENSNVVFALAKVEDNFWILQCLQCRMKMKTHEIKNQFEDKLEFLMYDDHKIYISCAVNKADYFLLIHHSWNAFLVYIMKTSTRSWHWLSFKKEG